MRAVVTLSIGFLNLLFVLAGSKPILVVGNQHHAELSSH